MTKPTSCTRCGGSKLVLGTVTDEGDKRRVTIVCEACGNIERIETTERIEAVRNWYGDN